MLTKTLYRMTANKPCRLIHSEDNRYLERYYLGNILGFTFYLHRFVAGDGDRALHDHPWRISAAVCLAGGYDEKRVKWFNPDTVYDCEMRKVRPGKINLISASTFHQVMSPRPETWTLFTHSKKIKDWGFLSKHEITVDSGEERLQPYYHRDRDPVSHRNWWETAPLGRDTDRAPLNPVS